MNCLCMGSNISKNQSFLDSNGCSDSHGRFAESFFIPVKLAALLEQPCLTGETELEYTWDPSSHSPNIYIHKDDPHILHRNPVAQSTDCARGKTGVSSGVHAWQILWKKKEFGSHAVVGVCTKDCPLNMQGYCNLIGSNSESWGWDLISMQAIHNVSTRSRNTRSTADRDLSNLSSRALSLNPMGHLRSHDRSHHASTSGSHKLVVDNSSVNNRYPREDLDIDIFSDQEPSIVMLLDMNQGNVSFVINGRYLGVCHRGLAGRTLYPAVNSVWGNCEISLRYLNGLQQEPPSLMFLSRHTILEHLSNLVDHARLVSPITSTFSSSTRGGNHHHQHASNSLSPSRDSNDNMSSRQDPREDRDARVRRLCLPRCLREELLNNWY